MDFASIFDRKKILKETIKKKNAQHSGYTHINMMLLAEDDYLRLYSSKLYLRYPVCEVYYLCLILNDTIITLSIIVYILLWFHR